MKPDETMMLATKRSEGPMTSDRKFEVDESNGLITFRTFKPDDTLVYGEEIEEKEEMEREEMSKDLTEKYERKVSDLDKDEKWSRSNKSSSYKRSQKGKEKEEEKSVKS